jgi:hypothetical protein
MATFDITTDGSENYNNACPIMQPLYDDQNSILNGGRYKGIPLYSLYYTSA